jgi:hypothetical protein
VLRLTITKHGLVQAIKAAGHVLHTCSSRPVDSQIHYCIPCYNIPSSPFLPSPGCSTVFLPPSLPSELAELVDGSAWGRVSGGGSTTPIMAYE